ncbi:MAG: GspE/PulE family protein, partial [Lacisediminimonas sp.]|nr:GspE/PulE family protein [Lacisediminimonas sp.]
DRALTKLLEFPPIAELGDSIVLLAVKERASDIHIESQKNEVLVRFRIDGMLVDRLFLPAGFGLPLTSRYKVISRMDITERRKPQDGRFSFALPAKSLDVRVSSLPAMHGEKIVLRLLGSLHGSPALDLDRLNFSPEVLRPFKATLQNPQGILFVTGPTGSGKSTTLYAGLNFINQRDINIVTIEDPIEYVVPTLTQVMVDEKSGRGFKEILRSVLRQDPDVILVGEIRDTETARIATQAALTGHLVLATLHTNDAIQATTRLVDMGVERYIVAPAVIGILSQRLVRRLCDHCKVSYQPDPEELRQYFFWRDGAPLPLFHAASGCKQCGGTGYAGRIGVHEFLKVTPQIREAIMNGRSYDEIQAIAVQQGFRTLRYDGFKKALRGLTSLGEIARAVA